jgi:hypothetical protein
MRWECSECGFRLERPRPPAVCRDCGTAGAIFVEAESTLEGDLEAETIYESWFERGNRARFRAA